MLIMFWVMAIMALALLGHKIPFLSKLFVRPITYPSQSRIDVAGVKLYGTGSLEHRSMATSVNLTTGRINYSSSSSIVSSFIIEVMNNNPAGESRDFGFRFYDYGSEENRKRGILERDWYVVLDDVRNGFGKNKEITSGYTDGKGLNYVYLDSIVVMNGYKEIIDQQRDMDLRCWDEVRFNRSGAARLFGSVTRFFLNMLLITFYVFVATMAYVAWMAITK